MNGAEVNPPAVDAATVRLLAAANGLDLAPARAADLVPFVQGVLAASAALARLDLGTLPVTGMPWAPAAATNEDDDDGV